MYKQSHTFLSDASDVVSIESLMQTLIELQPGPAATAALRHVSTGGKRIRGRLALAASKELGLDSREAVSIGAACELVHNASLVHDDIHDRSETRRGSPTICHEYGPDLAICVGDLLISCSYAALGNLQNSHLGEALFCMHRSISEAVRGQISDISFFDVEPYYADKNRLQSAIDNFCHIAEGKSASLLSLPIELALIMAGQSEYSLQAISAAKAFSVAYQAADDIEDAEDDIRNGRFNLVAMLRRHMSDNRALSVAKNVVLHHYSIASKLALELPQSSGEMLSILARSNAEKYSDADCFV